MSIIQPTIVLPEKDAANLPTCLELYPLFGSDYSYFRRLWAIFFERPKWRLTEDYYTYIDYFDQYTHIPANFVFDFASIPKIIPILSPAGAFAYPALPHDFIYRFGGLLLSPHADVPFEFVQISRKLGDIVFKTQAIKANNLKVLDAIATNLLRLFGKANYKPRNMFKEDWTKPVF